MIEVIEDPCCKCGRESAIGGHGIREGAIYDEYYCEDCYNGRPPATIDSGPAESGVIESNPTDEVHLFGHRRSIVDSGLERILQPEREKVRETLLQRMGPDGIVESSVGPGPSEEAER